MTRLAAGNGARDDDNNTDFYGPEHCLRSSSSWAEKYVDHLQGDGYPDEEADRLPNGDVRFTRRR